MAEAMELCLRFEEGDDESLHATLRVTLPKQTPASDRLPERRETKKWCAYWFETPHLEHISKRLRLRRRKSASGGALLYKIH